MYILIATKGKIYKRLNSIDKTHNYGVFYEKHFKPYKNNKLNILEIGSFKGSSTAAFLKYFKNSKIFCIDINHRNFLFKSKRVKLIELDYMKKTR